MEGEWIGFLDREIGKRSGSRILEPCSDNLKSAGEFATSLGIKDQ